MSERSKVGFLLGAGVSLACDAPTTAQLTEALLSERIPYERDPNGRYRWRAPGVGVPDVLLDQQVSPYLKCLERKVAAYYDTLPEPTSRSARPVNYEDLAYLTVQVLETMNRDRDNPALMAFVHELTLELPTTLDTLYETAEEALHLISDHVCGHLASLAARPGHLACVRDACAANAGAFPPILSLNHDLLIEQMLREARLPVNDMLQRGAGGRQALQVSLDPDKVNLLKLHGSINWFRWRPSPPRARHDRWDRWIGALDEESARRNWNGDDRPLILVGRFNKELAYAGAPFTELFTSARTALREVSTLVISGYSFGDKAVNTMIIDWIYGVPKGQRQIAIAHEDCATLRYDSRGAFGNKWDGLVGEGVLVELGKFLRDFTWEELRKRLKLH